MKIRWSPRARQDRLEITVFLEEQSRFAADDLDDRIDSSLDSLAHFPRLGRLGKVEGTRELLVQRTPYILIYSFSDKIMVLRLIHAAQQWPAEEQ